MKLNFIINKKYLLVHSLRQSGICPFPEWQKLRFKLWDKNNDVSCLLEGQCEWIFITNEKCLTNKLARDIKTLVDFGLKTKEFQKLYSETKKYLNFVKKQWQKNEKFVYDFLEKTLGLELLDKTIKVFITHPRFKNGIAFTNHNIIGWGHSEDWKNYSTVYLTHEIIHLLTKDYAGNREILHALIELACDNELRLRLNKRGKYFKEGKFDVGHKSLYKIEKKILPYWREYLKKKNKKASILALSKVLDKMSLINKK